MQPPGLAFTQGGEAEAAVDRLAHPGGSQDSMAIAQLFCHLAGCQRDSLADAQVAGAGDHPAAVDPGDTSLTARQEEAASSHQLPVQPGSKTPDVTGPGPLLGRPIGGISRGVVGDLLAL